MNWQRACFAVILLAVALGGCLEQPGASDADPQDGDAQRFRQVSEDVLLDNVTGKMWAKDNGKDVTWEEALVFCDTQSAGDFDDWRMPTIEELATLFESARDMEPKVTDLIGLTKCTLWGKDKDGNAGFQMLCGFASMPNLDTGEPRSHVIAVRK